MASPQFPEPPPAIEPSSQEMIDQALQRLSANKERWAALDLAKAAFAETPRNHVRRAAALGFPEASHLWRVGVCVDIG